MLEWDSSNLKVTGFLDTVLHIVQHLFGQAWREDQLSGRQIIYNVIKENIIDNNVAHKITGILYSIETELEDRLAEYITRVTNELRRDIMLAIIEQEKNK